MPSTSSAARRPGRRGHPALRVRGAVIAAASVVLTHPTDAVGQTGTALLGGTLGAAGGAWITMAEIAAEARADRYIFSPSDVGWRMAPIPVGAAAGALLGHRDPARMRRSLAAGGIGFASGLAVGALAGRMLWSSSEGAWSGALIGGAVGLVAGAVAGGLREGTDPSTGPALHLSLAWGAP